MLKPCIFYGGTKNYEESASSLSLQNTVGNARTNVIGSSIPRSL